MAKIEKTTLADLGSGNTKPTLKKSQGFILTVNESSLPYYDEIKSYITGLKTNIYYLCCEHIGQENKHYHIYCQFKSSIALSIKKLHGCHIETSYGSAQQNIAYVKAEDKKHKSLNITSILIDEEGEPKLRDGAHTIREIENMSTDEVKDVPAMYYNVVEKIKSKQQEEQSFLDMLTEIENDTLKGPEVYYLTGPSGRGKTYGAYKLALSKYKKEDIGKMLINNNFFKITNQNAKCFVIEEFRPSQLHASDFLQLIDKYGFNCNIKGGFITIRPKCFIICSIIPPEEIYKEEINEQFRRRLTKVYEVNENHELTEYLGINDIQL